MFESVRKTRFVFAAPPALRGGAVSEALIIFKKEEVQQVPGDGEDHESRSSLAEKPNVASALRSDLEAV